MSLKHTDLPDGPVVITGGEGFVGKWLRRELQNTWPGVETISWDLPAVDITQPDTYQNALAELTPAYIVHLAAIASVPVSLRDPDAARRVNVDGTQFLLDTVQAVCPSTKILFVSTSDIYGTAVLLHGAVHERPIAELSLSDCKPQNPYAESKLAAEHVVQDHSFQRTVRVRPFPHIGPGQGLGFVTSDFASQIAAIERGEQNPVLRVGNLEAQRDFTDVRDVVRAYRMLIEAHLSDDAINGEVYNVASGKATAIQSVLDEFLSLTETTIEVEQDPDRMRPSDVPVLIGDVRKFQDMLVRHVESGNWQPEISIQDSLRDILDWWRAQS